MIRCGENDSGIVQKSSLHLGGSLGNRCSASSHSCGLGQAFWRGPSILPPPCTCHWQSPWKKERFVLAIDEFPYLIQSNPAITGLFQKGWDEYLSESNIYLILFEYLGVLADLLDPLLRGKGD
jgi:hypothetical protein